MIEIPEAGVLAGQAKKTLAGKKIKSVIAAHSPHKFAWYHGDPANYQKLLKGCVIDGAVSRASSVEIGMASFINPRATLDILEEIRLFMMQEGIQKLTDIIGAARK